MPTEPEPRYVALYLGKRVEYRRGTQTLGGIVTDVQQRVEDHVTRHRLHVCRDDGFVDLGVDAADCTIITEEA